MHRILSSTILVILLLNTAVFAMERFEIVTTQEMKQMLEDRAAGKIDFILTNTLDEIIYLNSSIPGSVSLPWSRVDKVIHRLGDDKEKLIVTY
jgi:hypothetical protein